jgi:uncharacterized protein YkwD
MSQTRSQATLLGAVAKLRAGTLPLGVVKLLRNRKSALRKGGSVIARIRYAAPAVTVALLVTGLAVGAAIPASADNKRLNNGVVSNVYTVQRQAGCTGNLTTNPQLQLAAQWQTEDVLNNRALDGDVGSDGSLPQQRAINAGYHGTVAETVGINPALAISGVELINQWYYNPGYLAIMSDCANTQIGVWSENSLDRTVFVAVYGAPAAPEPSQ